MYLLLTVKMFLCKSSFTNKHKNIFTFICKPDKLFISFTVKYYLCISGCLYIQKTVKMFSSIYVDTKRCFSE